MSEEPTRDAAIGRQAEIDAMVLHLARGEKRADSTPIPVTTTWAELCSDLSTHASRAPFIRRGKWVVAKDGPYICGGKIDEGHDPSKCGFKWVDKTNKDGEKYKSKKWLCSHRRAKSNMRSVSLAMFDFDEKCEADRVREAFRGVSCIIYTTWSNGAMQRESGGRFWKLRVIVLLSEPRSPKSWTAEYRLLAAHFGAGVTDPTCVDSCRLMFLPSCPAGEEEYAKRWVIEGEPLDVEATLAAASAPDAARILEETRRKIATNKNGHKAIRDQGARVGRLICATFSREEALAHVRASVAMFTDTDREEEIVEAVDYGAEQQHADVETANRAASWVRTSKGEIANVSANALAVLEGRDEWAGCLGHDLLADTDVWLRRPPTFTEREVRELPSILVDGDIADVKIHFARTEGLLLGTEAVLEAVNKAARANSYDPLVDYMRDLRWDGIERIHTWGSKYLGVRDTELVRAQGASWLISGVARALAPGAKCEVHSVLVLLGDGGKGKTSAIKALAPRDEWYVGVVGDLASKDVLQSLHGRMIADLAELDSMARSEISAMKEIISRTTDVFRSPYARKPAVHHRRMIWAASVDHEDFLRDGSGSRRWWIWRVGETHPVDFDALRAVRDQLWAEAVVRYDAGARWWLSEALEAETAEVAAENTTQDAIATPVRRFLAASRRVTHELDDILTGIGWTVERRPSPADQARVVRELVKLGYVKRRPRIDGVQLSIYAPSALTPAAAAAAYEADREEAPTPAEAADARRKINAAKASKTARAALRKAMRSPSVPLTGVCSTDLEVSGTDSTI